MTGKEKTVNEKREFLVEGLLSLISIVYFSFVLFWILPERQARYAYFAPIVPFMRFWNLDQYWGFFGTYDRRTNFSYSGVATFDDGMKLVVEPPNRTKLNLSESIRFQKKMYLFNEYLGDPIFQNEDCARFLCRPFENSYNPPKTFSLDKIWSAIPAPGTKNAEDENEELQLKHLFTVKLDRK